MEVIKLNLIPGKACPVVHASQFDDGRNFKAELYEGVNVYTLDGTETLTAIVKKPDGNEVTVAVTNTSDNYVIITTTEQMTACAGGNLGTLRIEKGAVTIGTLNFILECQASPDTGIQSDSEIHNLEAQVNQMVEDAVAEQYDSNNVLFDTAPTSGHGVPYAVTSGGLWSWLRDLPLRAYPTASGAIATFDTSLALPLQDCTIAINAVQESGTPTPSSPKAISGFTGANIRVTGVNLWDEEWESGSISSSTGENTTGTGIRAKNYIPVKEDVIYYPRLNAELQTNATNIQVRFYDANKNYIGSDNYWGKTVLWNSNTTERTLRVPVGARFMRFALQPVYGSTYSDSNRISINYPSTDTAYHAYNANSTTTAITWQDEAGTVYGGSLDVTSGVLTVTHAIVDMGSFAWNNASGNLSSSSGIASDVKAPSANTEAFKGLCSCYEVAPRTGIADKQISVQTNGNIVISDTGIASMTGAQVQAYVTGFILVYELATPVTYQLTPTQISAIVGTNNIFTDTNGDTSVVYACSLKDYIDGQ